MVASPTALAKSSVSSATSTFVDPAAGSYGQNGGAPSEVSAKENFFVKAVPGVGESETKPQRTQVAGFSVDFF